jgi:hypothetical protein
MIGGRIRDIVRLEDKVWIETQDGLGHTNSICVIRTTTTERMAVGDHLWWGAGKAHWTPQDIPLHTVGSSGVLRPSEARREKARLSPVVRLGLREGVKHG